MLVQVVTLLIFVAIIGSILYGRRLIKTEKVDAVFGNPEAASRLIVNYSGKSIRTKPSAFASVTKRVATNKRCHRI